MSTRAAGALRPGLGLAAVCVAVLVAGCTESSSDTDPDTAQDDIVAAVTPLLDEYAGVAGGPGDVRRDGVTDIGCTDDAQRAQHQVTFDLPAEADGSVEAARRVYVDFVAEYPDLDVREGMNLAGEALTDQSDQDASFYEVREIVRDGYTMTLMVHAAAAGDTVTVAVDAFSTCLG
ncbi:hypothetical protein [Jiangella gansuensis]|uniref:hypothetical protein n=1 Tax=Jiangella gansuensis TaxID=281473 RepID=UPI00047DED9F|nr:hypothetical protein [Jiangella gansuensis]